ERFGKALSFVIDRARTDGVDVAPIGLLLRMLERIAVTLRCRGDKILGLVFLCDFQGMQGSQSADFQGFDSMDHVIHRAGRRSKVENIIDLGALERAIYIKLEKFEISFAAERFDVGETAGEKIINRNNRIAVSE